MNCFALFSITSGAMFKWVAEDGTVSVIELFFFRNVCIGALACSIVLCKRQNPFKGFQKALYKDLVIRSLVGHLNFALYNLAFTLLPMSFVVIIMQTSPFWTSILACCCLNESIRLIEIIGIFICFGGIVMIAISNSQQDEEKLNGEEEDETSPEYEKYLGMIVIFTSSWIFSV